MKYLCHLMLFLYILPRKIQGDDLKSNQHTLKQQESQSDSQQNKLQNLNNNVEKTRQSLKSLELFLFESPIKNGSLPVYDICTAFLKEFGSRAAKFIQCSVEKARPFRFCESCVTEYQKAVTVFQDILQDDGTRSGCSDVLLKADRIQVLDQVNNNIKNVWQQAYCDECFEESSIKEDTNGTVTFKFSEIAVEFNVLFNNMTRCIDRHSHIPHEFWKKNLNTSVCDDCIDIYRELNDKFKDAMVESKQEVCMDLVDMMNYTRITWGLRLNCTKSYTTNASIVIITAIIAVGTISFYVVTGLRGSRKEKKIMKQKRMSSRSAAALYKPSLDSQQEGMDSNEDGLDTRVVFS